MGVGGDKPVAGSHHLASAVRFGLWFLAFMLLESFVNSSFVALLGARTVNTAYSAGIFCTATGLLVFALMHARRASWCKRAFRAALAICSAAALGVASARHAALLAVSSCMALLACGFVGGRAHLGIAQAFGEGPACGRVLGAVTGSAVCLQFLVQNLMQGPVSQVACILASTAALALLDSRGMASDSAADVSTAKEDRAWPQDPEDKRRHGIFLVIAAAVLTVIFSLNDSIVVALDASGSLELFGGILLFYALGLVAAGCLFDLGPRFAFTYATVAVQMLAILVPYYLGTPAWYNLNMALFYFYGGFYVMFITAEFVTFSGQMSHRALWAGLGRTTRSFATSLSVIPISMLYASLGVVSLVALGAILNMVLLAVCVADALLLARYRLPELQEPQEGQKGGPEPAIVNFGERDIELFAQEAGLAVRERAVLVLMVTTEDENQTIANELDVSRRTLQRHLAHVYEKAGVQSRIGLYKAVAAYAACRRG